MGTTYEIVVDKKALSERSPVVMSDGRDDVIAKWVAMPADPISDPVQLFESRDASVPESEISGPRNQRKVSGWSGELVCTVSAKKTQSLFRTQWSVKDQHGAEVFTFVERLGDGLWRRLARPLPRSLGDGAPDPVSAILLAPLFAILAIKPWCQLLIRDPSGQNRGVIQFASNAKAPREHFILRFPDQEPKPPLLPAAVAAISVMH